MQPEKAQYQQLFQKKQESSFPIIQKSMHYIELSTHPDFSQEYMNQMDFDGSER